MVKISHLFNIGRKYNTLARETLITIQNIISQNKIQSINRDLPSVLSTILKSE